MDISLPEGATNHPIIIAVPSTINRILTKTPSPKFNRTNDSFNGLLFTLLFKGLNNFLIIKQSSTLV